VAERPPPGPSGSLELACDAVGHHFGRQRLFADVSFALSTPGSVCVAGPNGSGKSTLLRILAGLIEPARGRVTWRAGGRDLPRGERFPRLGFVSPDLHLYGELTVLENVRFFARARHLQGRDERWRELLVKFGLGAEGHKPYAALSSGLKQRAKFACAVLHDPAVLLLDEPTANLDRTGRDLIAGVMRAQSERGLLVIATNEEEEYQFGESLVRLG
jgi:heme exporter protein A